MYTEIPEQWGGDDEESDGNITDDVGETASVVHEAVTRELGGRRGHREQRVPEGNLNPPSPVNIEMLPRTVRRKAVLAPETTKTKKRRVEAAEVTEVVTVRLNSDRFPKEIRPEMFRDDELFNKLSLDRAAMVCHDYAMLLAKEKMKDKKKASQEKSDDTLAKIQVPAGEDNASDTLNTVARQLRPVNKEMADQMSWQARERKEIVRNLPLEVYGLVDLVATKPIELCHNLASNITIDMFCPGGKKATNTKQKACKTKDGELAVETSEVYQN